VSIASYNRAKRSVSITLIALTNYVWSAANEAESPPRFLFVTHDLGFKGKHASSLVTLKFDNATGDTWRFNGAEFIRVRLEDELSAMPKTAEERKYQILKDKMDAIVIPEVDFRESSINDVFRFMREASLKYDPDGKGINMALHIGPHRRPPDDQDFSFVELDPDVAKKYPPITFCGYDHSFQEVLTIVTSLADLNYRIYSNVVLIVPPWDHHLDIHRQFFPIRPRTAERIQKMHSEYFGTNVTGVASESSWKEFLSNFGMSFPHESSIRFMPSMGLLISANQGGNNAVLANMISAIDDYPPRPGRFRLIPVDLAKSKHKALLLLDSNTGKTWRYRVAGDAPGTTGEDTDFFQFVNEVTPNISDDIAK